MSESKICWSLDPSPEELLLQNVIIDRVLKEYETTGGDTGDADGEDI